LIVSPASAALTAFWMLRKSQRFFFLQTVCVAYGRGGLGSTLPGSLGSGYVWAFAPAGASRAIASVPATAILSEVRMVFPPRFYGSTTYQPVIPVS
jgi:hypothetical protein